MYRLALLFGFFAAVLLFGAGGNAAENYLGPWGESIDTREIAETINKDFDSWPTYPDGKMFDLNSLDWHAIARDLNYRRAEERSVGLQGRVYGGVPSLTIVGEYLDLFPQDDDFHKRVEVRILRAFDARVEGKVLLLESVTGDTSMGIRAEMLVVVEGGPGDRCLTWKYRDRKPGIVSGTLWFYRRGIAVSLSCDDKKRDLLPLAKAIDAKLISCPLVAPEALLSKLPAIEVGQIEPTGEKVCKLGHNRPQYRAPLKVSAPLDKKTQEIVALITPWGDGLTWVRGDNHVVIGIDVERAPYRQGKCILHVGILDRKALVVKWAAPREVPEPEKQGQTAK